MFHSHSYIYFQKSRKKTKQKTCLIWNIWSASFMHSFQFYSDNWYNNIPNSVMMNWTIKRKAKEGENAKCVATDFHYLYRESFHWNGKACIFRWFFLFQFFLASLFLKRFTCLSVSGCVCVCALACKQIAKRLALSTHDHANWIGASAVETINLWTFC